MTETVHRIMSWWQHLSWSHAALVLLVPFILLSVWRMISDWADGGPDYDVRD